MSARRRSDSPSSYAERISDKRARVRKTASEAADTLSNLMRIVIHFYATVGSNPRKHAMHVEGNGVRETIEYKDIIAMQAALKKHIRSMGSMAINDLKSRRARGGNAQSTFNNKRSYDLMTSNMLEEMGYDNSAEITYTDQGVDISMKDLSRIIFSYIKEHNKAGQPTQYPPLLRQYFGYSSSFKAAQISQIAAAHSLSLSDAERNEKRRALAAKGIHVA